MAFASNAQPDTSRSLLTELAGWSTTQAPVRASPTCSVSGALWLKLPLVPCRVRERVPVEALAGRVNDTCADALAAMVIGEEGEVVAPEGRPLAATETDPENPLIPAMETVTGALVIPPAALTEDAEAEIEKSPAGGGGGVEEPPLLQPASSASATVATSVETELTRAITSRHSFHHIF